MAHRRCRRVAGFAGGLVLLLLWWRSSSTDITASVFKQQPPLHFVYSVGCQPGHSGRDDEWQLLQALVLDHSFAKARQRGKLTRLVSGCEEQTHPQHELMQMGLTRTLFFPRHDKVGSRTYVQVNRPWALLEFFEKHTAEEGPDVVYVVIDPDFVWRRPMDEQVFEELAKNGVMVTQFYSMSTENFQRWGGKACELAGLNGCERVRDLVATSSAARRQLSIGVPYVMRKKEWLELLPAWLKVIPEALNFYPGIESDMYALAIASAALGHKHVVRMDFMCTCMWTDRLETRVARQANFLHLCQDYSVPETRGDAYRVNPTKEVWSATRRARHPNATHAFVFNKHWLKLSKLYECATPLLVEPPPIFGDETDLQDQWHRLMVSEAVAAYNDAMKAWKGASCNLEKRLVMHEMHRGRFGGGLNHVIDG